MIQFRLAFAWAQAGAREPTYWKGARLEVGIIGLGLGAFCTLGK